MKPVTTIDEAAAYSRGFGKMRYESGSGQTQYPSGVAHLARDFYFPPGTPVYTPVAGTWDGWGTSNEDGSLSMGWVGKLIGDDGYYYRYVHISDVSKNKSLVKGARVAVGTLVGATPLGKLGASDSQLHFDVTPGRSYSSTKRIDPLIALGVGGFNRLIGAGTAGTLMLSGGAIVGLFLLGSATIAGVIYLGRRAGAHQSALPSVRVI